MKQANNSVVFHVVKSLKQKFTEKSAASQKNRAYYKSVVCSYLRVLMML